jgi:hypothetical protein
VPLPALIDRDEIVACRCENLAEVRIPACIVAKAWDKLHCCLGLTLSRPVPVRLQVAVLARVLGVLHLQRDGIHFRELYRSKVSVFASGGHLLLTERFSILAEHLIFLRSEAPTSHSLDQYLGGFLVLVAAFDFLQSLVVVFGAFAARIGVDLHHLFEHILDLAYIRTFTEIHLRFTLDRTNLRVEVGTGRLVNFRFKLDFQRLNFHFLLALSRVVFVEISVFLVDPTLGERIELSENSSSERQHLK